MNHTATILSALETMRLGELAKREKTSVFKALAYKKAMDEIRRLGRPILSAEDVAGVPAIGEKISEKIREIIATGQLAAAERVRATLGVDALEELMTIHGIGPVKARELVESGIRSVGALQMAVAVNPALLNETQKLGLKYAAFATQRISRAEMDVHADTLYDFLPPLGAKGSRDLEGEVVGSYRRGLASSGDIDLLLTYKPHISAERAVDLFHDYLDALLDEGYILDELVSGPKKWMGYVKAGPRGTPRRLDVLLTSPTEYPYAVLYFTGSDRFNVAMRRWATERGYTLNEHGMAPLGVAGGAGRPPVPGMRTEKDIFDFLGLRYVQPQERVDGHQVTSVT